MSHHFGGLLLLLAFGGLLSESSDVKDLTQTPCRIAGLVKVENKDKKLNYTMAESACQVLGLQLANKDQVEKARRYGYETCSYGWIMDKVGAIPRIHNNENCGKNKTGVLTWKVELSKIFVSAYCFNVSDTRINSCEPGLMVTEPPSAVVAPTSASNMAAISASTVVPTSGSTVAPTSTSTVAPTSASTMVPTGLNTETVSMPIPTIHVRTTAAKTSTQSLHTTSMSTEARTPPSTAPPTTPTEDIEPPKKQENQMAQKSKRVVFGGLPTTLLILALLFFVAAVALAVCYVKRYKTHLLFSTKKQKKESVETKVFKDSSGAENTKEEERCTDLQGVESPQKCTGISIEAEV